MELQASAALPQMYGSSIHVETLLGSELRGPEITGPAQKTYGSAVYGIPEVTGIGFEPTIYRL